MNDAEREELAKRDLATLRAAGMSKGELALNAVEIYQMLKLPAPAWALGEIISCYRNFKNGKRTAFVRDVVAWQEPAPNTLGEAFGVRDHRGGAKTALKRRREALVLPQLVALFTGQGCDALPRTKDGFDKAAKQLGITAKEVEELLPKRPRTPRA
jgi:hypothetical protein